ncbi:MAG: tetratricopeptide repeat protein [Pseudomonadota bacterium]
MKYSVLVLLTLSLWGCSLAPYETENTSVTPEPTAVEPQEETVEQDVQVTTIDDESLGPGTVIPVPKNPAVDALQKEAQSAVLAGNYDNAAMALERAVRIEPRDPKVWLELAKVRFTQGQYAQARELAQKARRLAGVDGQIKSEAERIINRAR